jgi:hypothetical protein
MTIRLGDGLMEVWTLIVERDPHVSCRTWLESPGATQSWTAEGGDVFACLCVLRNQIEPHGLRICCNGCRRNEWMSGLLRDWGDGQDVYMGPNHGDTSQLPQTVATLDPAPPDEVVSLREQLDCIAVYMGWGDWRPGGVLRSE